MQDFASAAMVRLLVRAMAAHGLVPPPPPPGADGLAASHVPLAYKRSVVEAVLRPVNGMLMVPIRIYDVILGAVFFVLLYPFRLFRKSSHLPDPTEEVEHALEIIHDSERREAARKQGE